MVQRLPSGPPCQLCGAPLPYLIGGTGGSRCVKCKHWNIQVDKEDDAETVLLSQSVRKRVERFKTGFLDDVFGGGLVISSTNLIAGPPGAGKTTLFLQLSDAFIEQRETGEVIYIANEQSDDEIAETAVRIQVKHMDRIRIVRAMGGLKRNLADILTQYKPIVIILDSLSKLVGDDLAFGKLILDQLKVLSVEHRAPGLIVNQINKGGDQAGLKSFEHAVDATFMLEKDDTDGSRFFFSTKNRFGQAPIGVELVMSAATDEPPGKLYRKPENTEEDEPNSRV